MFLELLSVFWLAIGPFVAVFGGTSGFFGHVLGIVLIFRPGALSTGLVLFYAVLLVVCIQVWKRVALSDFFTGGVYSGGMLSLLSGMFLGPVWGLFSFAVGMGVMRVSGNYGVKIMMAALLPGLLRFWGALILVCWVAYKFL